MVICKYILNLCILFAQNIVRMVICKYNLNLFGQFIDRMVICKYNLNLFGQFIVRMVKCEYILNLCIHFAQFIERMVILLMPAKYQPDYNYLRHVRTSRVHMFTLVQMLCMAIMWVMKSIKAISMIFPLMVCHDLPSHGMS